MRQGLQLADAGEFLTALAYLDRAIDENPMSAQARVRRGIVLYRLQRHAESVQALEDAIALDDRNPDAYFYLGNALAASRDYVAAIGAYRRAIELAPQPATWHNLGTAYARLGMMEAGVKTYQEAIKLDGDHAATRFQLGMLLAQLGRTQEATMQVSALGSMDRDLAVRLQKRLATASTSRPAH